MDKIKYIFFDIYGTLAGFHPTRESIQKKILEKHKIYLNKAQISLGYKEADEFMAYQKKIKPLRMMSNDEKELFFVKYESKILEKYNIYKKKSEILKIWSEITNEKYKLQIFNDVYRNLEYLKGKNILAAGITNMESKGDQLIHTLKLNNHLEFIVTSKDADSEKPDSKIFNFCLDKANILPENVIIVGDQIESDILGAVKARIKPILIDRYGYYDDFRDCIKISCLDDLRRLF
ncbi:MAG: HAD-IA family hydrolase [Dehalococcoidales bacterium]|nr:HAD-IA family hydrolase [Dehalococcoidales bacterium]